MSQTVSSGVLATTEAELLSDWQVATILGRSRSSLQKDRVAGRGPPFVKENGSVRYRRVDVQRYLASLRSFTSTSEADEARASDKAA